MAGGNGRAIVELAGPEEYSLEHAALRLVRSSGGRSPFRDVAECGVSHVHVIRLFRRSSGIV